MPLINTDKMLVSKNCARYQSDICKNITANLYLDLNHTCSINFNVNYIDNDMVQKHIKLLLQVAFYYNTHTYTHATFGHLPLNGFYPQHILLMKTIKCRGNKKKKTLKMMDGL